MHRHTPSVQTGREWFEWFLVLVFTFVFTFPCAGRLRAPHEYLPPRHNMHRNLCIAYDSHSVCFLRDAFNLASLFQFCWFFLLVFTLSYRTFPSCTMCLHRFDWCNLRVIAVNGMRCAVWWRMFSFWLQRGFQWKCFFLGLFASFFPFFLFACGAVDE